MAILVLNVVADEDLEDDVADDLGMLLEETMVAACSELNFETIEDATEEVFIDEVEDAALLADLSCGFTE